jgi:hypothetical protein
MIGDVLEVEVDDDDSAKSSNNRVPKHVWIVSMVRWRFVNYMTWALWGMCSPREINRLKEALTSGRDMIGWWQMPIGG